MSEQLVGEDVPKVTVQLPLFNERTVAQRLVACVGALDRATDKLQVQVLDDSTDETVDIVAEAVAEQRAQGLDIVHVRRSNRQGFKAGALAHGLEHASGEFVAIFDADFLPEPDFLRRAMARFTPQIGLVQARWGWLNPRASILTRAQTMHLDAHFTVEQQARSSGDMFMGFNGTAGVWRRRTIDEAGGWHADTLTEDLDLSFRAQLHGWTLAYVDALEAPSELPEAFAAVRTQQHRWMKGARRWDESCCPPSGRARCRWGCAFRPRRSSWAALCFWPSCCCVYWRLCWCRSTPGSGPGGCDDRAEHGGAQPRAGRVHGALLDHNLASRARSV